jgi:hypothetical protein
MQSSDIIFNLVSALAGGFILKIWDSFFSTKKESKDSEIALIEKMQIQIDSVNKRQDELQESLTKVSTELDSWKDKYYKLLDKYQKLMAKYLPNHLTEE